VVKNLFHTLRFRPCTAIFCPFGANGSGEDVERQYGVAGDSMVMLFGVCIGYAALIIVIGYLALVLQLRVQLQRKAPARRRGDANGHHNDGSIAARVLDLPPYALAFASRGGGGQQGGGAAGGHAPQGGQEPRRRFLFQRRGGGATPIVTGARGS
jgi:hypothetical protein